jgi:ribosomal protein S6
MTDETKVEKEEKVAGTSPEGFRVYELGYHIFSAVPKEGLDKEVGGLRNAVEACGGSFIAEGTPELITLAYPLFVNEGGKHTKHERAYFGWLKFETNPEGARKLREEHLNAQKNLLRFMLFETAREDTRARLQEIDLVLREVKTHGTIERKISSEDTKKIGEQVSEAELDKTIDELIGE